MALSISRLRRWIVAAAAALLMLVAGTYFYARHKVQNALKQVPGKIGLEIQQTAQGFSISKSEQGRTLFKMEASKAVQFKDGGRTELHDVRITVYGRDSSRFDQLYGSDFEYDPHSGDAVAQGEVQIDLNANPTGTTQPDQAAPGQLKNAIHLKTSGLIFNQKTGNAYTKKLIEFQLPQGSGSAQGFTYTAKDNALTLDSQVRILIAGVNQATITASRGSIRKDSRTIVLDAPSVQSANRRLTAEKASIFLRDDNTVERLYAEGAVNLERQSGPGVDHLRAAQMNLLTDGSGDQLRVAEFNGDVEFDSKGSQAVRGRAGRLVVNFGAHNQAAKVHAEQDVQIEQLASAMPSSASAQSANRNNDTLLTTSALDATLADGNRMERADTLGPAQITIHPASAVKEEQTLVTADKFVAGFDNTGQLISLHGAPNAHITNQNGGQPSQVSTSEMVDAVFAHAGLDSITQAGNVVFSDGTRKAFAQSARYSTNAQVITLNGAPRITDIGMSTTAHIVRFNRATRDAFAEGDVKTTYNDLKSQPNGALLSSSSPIHVTAQTMTAHQSSSTALYSGDVRLWQDANVVEAPAIEFNRDQRSVNAQSTKSQLVSTVLFQSGTNGKVMPVAITSGQLRYVDADRKAQFLGGVTATADDMTLASHQMDILLEARGPDSASPQALTGKINRIIAEGEVVITQPKRKATGDQLVYTVADDAFELTGGPPCIFDAEHGQVTGVSLTLYRHDDRVLVKGNSATPAVTETRVAR